MATTRGFGKNEILAVSLLAVMSFFLFADQNLMAPNLTQIGNEFGFTAVERDSRLGGDISLMFWLLGGIVTIAIGYCTDRIPRKKLFILIILIGEIPCVLTGFVRDYMQFFWLRALTGIAIGGAIPITFSLIGDYFSNKNRAKAVAYISLAQGLGIAGGQMLAGFIGPSMGWRIPFIIVGIPNFLLVIPFILCVREPARGRCEETLQDLIESGHSYAERINWTHFRNIFTIKTNIIVFLQAVPGCVPWGVFFIYLNDFYVQEKGFTVAAATLIIMALGAGAIIGGFIGGLAGNMLYNRKPAFQAAFCGISVLAGIIPVAIIINYPPQIGVAHPSFLVPAVVGFIAGIVITSCGPNMYAILLNVNSPETRGSILALFNLVNDLGKGLGPFVISIFIVAVGRMNAFNIANLFWVACGVLLFGLIWTIEKDQASLARYLREKAGGISQTP
jgi:MFS family permease